MPWKECNSRDERLKFIARLLEAAFGLTMENTPSQLGAQSSSPQLR
jgi:hypothetical protein